MYEKILEILRTDRIFLAGHSEKCAKEIADMNGEFIEWKDWHTNLKNIRHYFKHNTYRFEGKMITLDDLFNYWYKEIYNK